MSKQTLDGIWGDEGGKMLIICKTDETGVEFSIGMPPSDMQAFITLAPYRVKRLIDVLQKCMEKQKSPCDASSREIKEELKPRKMSIAEIEALINKEDNRKIQITEDGMVLVGPARDLDTQDAEIDRLKKAVETEFQRAEGKEEMKKWFQEEITKLKAQNEKYREALVAMVAQGECYCVGKRICGWCGAEEALKGE